MRPKFSVFFVVADICPSIFRESGCNKLHEKSSAFSTVREIKFFHCCNSVVGEPTLSPFQNHDTRERFSYRVNQGIAVTVSGASECSLH